MEELDQILEGLLQELKRGTLVLAVLLGTSKPEYGYELVGKLQEKGIDIEQNTLYPLLRRLEKQGLLVSSWDTNDSRPRRYYNISKEGKKVRAQLFQEWNSMNEAVMSMEESHENH
jgi:PadR family transcriptional regulator, regulatory protein PadR